MGFHRGVWKVLCLLVVVFGVAIPSLLLWIVVRVDSTGGELEKALRSLSTHDRKPLDYLPEGKEVNELRMQIRELEEIRASVRDELRVFEQQRSRLGKEISVHKDNLARVKKELSGAKIDLQETRGKLSKVTRDLYDKVDPVAPSVANVAPIVILPAQNKVSSLEDLQSQPHTLEEDSSFVRCSYSLCFHYTRCPLTHSFSAFVYNEASPSLLPALYKESLVTDLVTSLKEGKSFTSEPNEACVFVAIIDSSTLAPDIESRLHSLPHWGREGLNHVLIELPSSAESSSVLDGVRTGRAIIARAVVSHKKPLRAGYDLLIPPTIPSTDSWRELPKILPAFREMFLYFEGEYVRPKQSTVAAVSPSDLESLQDALKGGERVHLETQCPGEGDVLPSAMEGEWSLCGGWSHRETICSKSTFSLILGPGEGMSGTGTVTYTRLVEALKCGSIPVVIGIKTLPFDDVIDWEDVAVIFPSGRFSELHYILRSIGRDTVAEYRLRGRHIYLTYLSSPLKILQSTLAVVRYHALHPPPVSTEYSGAVLASQTGRQRRVQSPVLTQNFSTYSHAFWNSPPGPFFMYPTTPFSAGPISGTQYTNLDEKAVARLPFHIIEGGGITGPNFEDLLLGNHDEEQFTVVMLTYQRNDVLIEALQRLKEVSFLNKVVVVWNNEQDPPHELQWPNINVPVEVVRGKGNSLNNRFLPFKEIETEAVLSIDDDVHLRPDEIQFAFRVWREARDRIVGFPGRFHAYDLRHDSWLYNSNYTCELSMVLTGAAFFHKYYSYLYTYWQPPEVRALVDQHMNCEDIAMNFLVSHVTRKPPLKVTSRWTFRCPGCPDTLSTNDSHFNERHVCMKVLTDLYGYMPLLYTQFRVDSVLFKTRLPSKLQKCYQFI